MARQVAIHPSAEVAPAKVRNPWLVLLFTIGTLGIYSIFWWYYANRELKDLGRARGVDLGDSPGTSVLAYTLGGLVFVPQLLTIVNTCGRTREAQRQVGLVPFNPGVATAVWILSLTLAGGPYVQAQLNKVWAAIESGGDGRLTKLEELRDGGTLDAAQFEAERARLGL